MIKKYGAEMLRLWVAASDYRDDVRVSDEILDGLAEGYRKIRNTFRFALGNLVDFDPARDSVPVSEMEPFDCWAYARMVEWQDTVAKAYADYEFHVAYHATMEFVSVTLSSVYFDVVKDRLYTSRAGGKPRRSAQTLLHMVRTCCGCRPRCSPSRPTRPGSSCRRCRPGRCSRPGFPPARPRPTAPRSPNVTRSCSRCGPRP